MLTKTLLVGAGGFIGASARYLASGLVHRLLPATFPYGTFVVNVTGCFLIGLLAVLAEEQGVLGPAPRLFLMVGVLGGFTTFSTFGYESANLLADGSQLAASLNIAGQVLLGLLAVWLGALTARGLT